MSNISDMWGGFIHISAEFDSAQTRKLIKKLKKALDEMEGM